MIANLGDHASRRLLEVLRRIAAGELVGAGLLLEEFIDLYLAADGIGDHHKTLPFC